MNDLPPQRPLFLPEQALPPYSYLTGHFPHPIRDPRGHSFGQAPAVALIDPPRWAESREYLAALDLFNHGYYWEAHEAWEGLWHGCGRQGTTADLLKGLIKLAAAGVKVREGRPVGVERHAKRAGELFAATQAAAAGRGSGWASIYSNYRITRRRWATMPSGCARRQRPADRRQGTFRRWNGCCR